MRDIHDYTKKIYLPQIDDQYRALVLGECGGFGLEESGWSYNSYPDRYFLTYAFEQLILHLSSRLSAMIYTQLSDVETESNGIFTYNREEIKFIPDHLNCVLTKNYSRLYKLEYIWNLTSIPYRNYTHLSISKTFPLKLTKDFYRLYFYICYLYSFVKITINHQYKIILNETHQRRNYHYILLPNDLFHSSLNKEHFLDIQIVYQSKFDNDSFVYINRTFFYLNLAMLSE
jgi:hypothetical protein